MAVWLCDDGSMLKRLKKLGSGTDSEYLHTPLCSPSEWQGSAHDQWTTGMMLGDAEEDDGKGRFEREEHGDQEEISRHNEFCRTNMLSLGWKPWIILRENLP
jgi:hypothetical protein